MGGGFQPVHVHPALEHPSSGLRLLPHVKKSKRKLVPVDLASTRSYANAGSVLDEPATTPGQKSVMLECDHRFLRNYAEHVINVHRLDGGDVRVIDVLRAIHDFLHEPLPKVSSPINRTKEVEQAVVERRSREEHSKGKDRSPSSSCDLQDSGEENQLQYVKMDLLEGKTCFVGLSRSSTHDYKWLFRLDNPRQA